MQTVCRERERERENGKWETPVAAVAMSFDIQPH